MKKYKTTQLWNHSPDIVRRPLWNRWWIDIQHSYLKELLKWRMSTILIFLTKPHLLFSMSISNKLFQRCASQHPLHVFYLSVLTATWLHFAKVLTRIWKSQHSICCLFPEYGISTARARWRFFPGSSVNSKWNSELLMSPCLAVASLYSWECLQSWVVNIYSAPDFLRSSWTLMSAHQISATQVLVSLRNLRTWLSFLLTFWVGWIESLSWPTVLPCTVAIASETQGNALPSFSASTVRHHIQICALLVQTGTALLKVNLTVSQLDLVHTYCCSVLTTLNFLEPLTVHK